MVDWLIDWLIDWQLSAPEMIDTGPDFLHLFETVVKVKFLKITVITV